MIPFPPTSILRHRKENLKKCSLRGLESREDMRFYTYPWNCPKPDLSNYVVLAVDGKELSKEDSDKGIFLVDGTWRYAEKMLPTLGDLIEKRSLPKTLTAYPRKQEIEDGLASVEALYLAYLILGRDPKGLLDHYHWKEEFLNGLKTRFPLADSLK